MGFDARGLGLLARHSGVGVVSADQGERPAETIMRFRVPGPLHSILFVRQPVSITPPDGTTCFVDQGDGRGWSGGHSPAMWRGGEWLNLRGKPLGFVPTYWTTFEAKPDAK